MSEREYKLFIKDMLDSIDKIDRYLKDVDYEGLVDDEKTVDALVRNFEIIGEAAKNLPQPIREQCPAIPWKRIIGMRNKIIHEYFGVDLDIVWETAHNFLPSLKDTLKNLYQQID